MVAINGFTVPATDDRKSIGVKTYAVPGRPDILLPVRAEVAPLLLGAASEWNRYIEPLRVGHCWGYAWRLVRGGSTPSFHSAGIAVDLNAPEHPMGTDPARNFTPAQLAQLRRIAAKYGLRSGAFYTGRKDGMHLEVILPRAEALALVKRLQTPPKPKPAPVVHTVVRGENLTLIAAKYRTTVAAILRLNPTIKNANKIQVNQRIRVR